MATREIVVRNLTSTNWLNRDFLITESIQQPSCITTVKRRCTYHIESHVTIPSTDDAIPWAQQLDPHPPRQVFVTKDLDPDTGGEHVVYKVLGHFYVVLDREVFCIGYRHILAMTVEPTETLCET